MIIGDALVVRVWEAQQREGRPLERSEMASILRVPGLSVDSAVHALLGEHPYPIETFLEIEEDGTWAGRCSYYVTRRTVYPPIVSGKDNSV